MGVAAPTKMVEAFAFNAPTGNVAGGKTVPFPVLSQVGTNPGLASLNDGFTVANMTPLADSGLPMSGPDLNGILYLISSNVAASSAGQVFNAFDGTYATAIGGYAVGAIVQSATNFFQLFINLLANNTNNPDVTITGWMSLVPLYSASSLAAGTYANNTFASASDYILGINPTGTVVLNGFVAQKDGQRVTVYNSGSGTIQLGVAAGGSGNQISANAGPLVILPKDTITIQYVAAIAAWIIV